MTRSCRQCSKQFEIPEEDLQYYKSLSQTYAGQIFEMPAPTLCFSCRHQKRLAFRNEMYLYHRKCDLSGKQVISMYSMDKPYKIFDQHVWHSDDWDPLDYGRDVDFDRPFFEQLKELQLEVPRIALNNFQPENSDYCNLSFRNKNSYLVFTADFNEDSAYCRFSDRNYQCLDCDYSYDCTRCYDCMDMHQCTGCSYSHKCINSSGLQFCFNMIGCHDCIGSANLRNNKYCIFNQQYSKEEFEAEKKKLALHTYSGVKAFQKKYKEFLKTQPRRNLELVNCENSVGDYLRDCKNAQQCYNCVGLEDCKYMMNCYHAKDCYDWDFVAYTGSERCHEMASSAYNLVNCHFGFGNWEGGDSLFYCDSCLYGNKHLFGCVGLRKKEYCILNKKYSPGAYEEMVAKIITHMQKTGEWGEFFPMDFSTFAYNETVANEYFPLSKEQVLERGWSWIDDDSEKLYKGPVYEIADNVQDVDKDICKEILKCEATGKPYKIIPQELSYCKLFGVPVPRVSHRERHRRRMNLRNGWELWPRDCYKCKKNIYSTYKPGRPEPVYCGECYKEEIY